MREQEAEQTYFSGIPGDARLWVFGTQAALRAEQVSDIEKRLQEFVDSWKSHAADVTGDFLVFDDRFVLVAADQSITAVSGCSIDGLFRSVRDALEQAGVPLADQSEVFFRGADGVQSANRLQFAELVRSKEIGAGTKVFDTTVQTVRAFREHWERSFADSWHAKLFPLEASGSS